MIGQLHDQVLLALEVAARRRHKATLAPTEHQKHKLDVNGYHRMQREMNETTFLDPIDADTTKANIYYIKKKFINQVRQQVSSHALCFAECIGEITTVITGPEMNTTTTDTNGAEDDAPLIRKHKALCYQDIVLWIVQDPNGRGRDVLAMEVFFRCHKGVDRKPKPTVFLFRENPLPILCPVTHFLAQAIRDDAIEVDGFMHAAPFFSTQIRRSATKVHWKPSKLKIPVFRKSVRTAGGWIKSATEPMKYSTYAFYLNRIGSELGSKGKWTLYCFRRGHANALLGVAPDSIIDQVLRHDPMTGCMQNAY
ncbi:hypothetical protein J3459_011848 [Metarhizium acridum]|uniref:uncharacterized protein n=1 Tax=Metarhizium acridum TaxID=92637 RepID=UPI001C6CD932|nr:hypothetical protein J3458_009547 [Metarhizium acridum]KAG8418988.1 hypothetical protein J3459_011848 [Metarhizium acridum]